MSNETKRRRPRAVSISAPNVEIDESPIDDLPEATLPAEPKRKSGIGWIALFASALFGLIGIGLFLWAEQMVRELLVRYPPLGWVALGLAVLVVLGFLGFLWREIAAIRRLSTLDGLRERFARAHEKDDSREARSATDSLVALYRPRPETAAGRAKLREYRQGILEARDLVELTEETLIEPIDRLALARVSVAARRVSLVTALSPRALIDIAMVAVQCVRLTREIAGLYGARPGFLGALRLVRHMLAHLALTGGLAATEGLVGQVLGHSLAARLSARLGEGVINGLLTARVGLAAISVTRPMPYLRTNGPTISEVTRGIAGLGGGKEDPVSTEASEAANPSR